MNIISQPEQHVSSSVKEAQLPDDDGFENFDDEDIDEDPNPVTRNSQLNRSGVNNQSGDNSRPFDDALEENKNEEEDDMFANENQNQALQFRN